MYGTLDRLLIVEESIAENPTRIDMLPGVFFAHLRPSSEYSSRPILRPRLARGVCYCTAEIGIRGMGGLAGKCILFPFAVWSKQAGSVCCCTSKGERGRRPRAARVHAGAFQKHRSLPRGGAFALPASAGLRLMRG